MRKLATLREQVAMTGG